jgi:hypothetical protein
MSTIGTLAIMCTIKPSTYAELAINERKIEELYLRGYYAV